MALDESSLVVEALERGQLFLTPELRALDRRFQHMDRLIVDPKGRCHVVESLMRVRRVSQLKSCGGDDFAPRLHG